MTTTADYLRQARALIENPEHWAANPFERTFEGPEGKMCALDALGCVEYERGTDYVPAYNALAGASAYISVAHFNDHPTTTHADVLALYDRAIAATEKEKP